MYISIYINYIYYNLTFGRAQLQAETLNLLEIKISFIMLKKLE